PTKLNVYKNDAESWDYTTPTLGSSTHKNDATGNGRPAPLLAEPRYGAAPQPYGSTPQVTFPPGAGHDRYEENFNGPATYAEPYVERYGIKSDFSGREPLHPTPPRPGYVPTLGQTPPSSTQGSVMMVYGLQPDKVNTDKLFNLFCLYGNVTKVKFLKTKEGCAMIQMGDNIAVERCLQNLNNVTIGTDGRLQLGFSKQAFLSDVTNPYILPDKTASFKDFTGSKNNRFLNPAMANKNRIQPPSKIVHFFNTPPDLTEETVNRVFVERGIEAPTTVKLFPLKSERSSSGLIEFSSVGIAVAAIMECNHTALENSNGKFPYIMKLCFSSSRTIPTSFPPSSGSASSNSAATAITLSPVLPPPPPVPPPLPPPTCLLIATPTLYPTVPPPPPPPLPTFWPFSRDGTAVELRVRAVLYEFFTIVERSETSRSMLVQPGVRRYLETPALRGSWVKDLEEDEKWLQVPAKLFRDSRRSPGKEIPSEDTHGTIYQRKKRRKNVFVISRMGNYPIKWATQNRDAGFGRRRGSLETISGAEDSSERNKNFPEAKRRLTKLTRKHRRKRRLRKGSRLRDALSLARARLRSAHPTDWVGRVYLSVDDARHLFRSRAMRLLDDHTLWDPINETGDFSATT
ncbi:hypothetical protein HN011_003568, partial [Eciton burchellii]